MLARLAILVLRIPAALCLALALSALAARAGADLRFSVSLAAADLASCGLHRLSSDQVAVLDALVRRDLSNQGGSQPPPDAKPSALPATFSERLTAGERQTAGLPALTAEELARLNAAVERFHAGRLARTLLAPPTFLTGRERVAVSEKNKEREIHGSFSLSYGMGSGGYREKSGSMVLNFEDPAKGYAVTIGYTETHTKGGVPYYLYRDPAYDRLPAAPEPPPRP